MESRQSGNKIAREFEREEERERKEAIYKSTMVNCLLIALREREREEKKGERKRTGVR